MFHYLNKRILIGFFLALALLVWLAVYSFINTKKLTAASQNVARSHEVLYHAERVLAVASGIELGQRGFSLTGNEEFLQIFETSVAQIGVHYQSLVDLAQNDGMRYAYLKELDLAIKELSRFSTSAVEARKKDFEAAASLNSSMQGKRALDAIRKTISAVKQEESALLKERMEANANQLTNFNISFIGFLLLTAMIVFSLLLAINVSLRERDEAERRLLHASRDTQDLYDNAPCGYHSLDPEGVFIEINNTLLKWLGYQSKSQVIGNVRFVDVISEQDVGKFLEQYPLFKARGYVGNIDLTFKRIDGTEFPVILSSTSVTDGNGNFLKSRSTTFDNTERKAAENQIKELNKELEAFTYSVSHDLRAPLRSIDGYTRILQEDYSGNLDAEGKRLMNVVINNAKRMGQLIDDLLDFSRLGRKDVQHSNIDMKSLVASIVRELMTQQASTAAFEVGDLLPSKGDKDMIRQVWVNLVSNAIKYTGKTIDPRIIITSWAEGDEIIYAVRDNGVGFDMKYEHKLFGVFQRLHRIQDFSGTGVGLAIVKRIVSRHNGRVWAEGQVNQGATFYFSIPQS